MIRDHHHSSVGLWGHLEGLLEGLEGPLTPLNKGLPVDSEDLDDNRDSLGPFGYVYI